AVPRRRRADRTRAGRSRGAPALAAAVRGAAGGRARAAATPWRAGDGAVRRRPQRRLAAVAGTRHGEACLVHPLLAGLNDVVEGAEPSWWPPAPGWLLLAGVLLTGLLVLVWRWRRGSRRRAAVLSLFDEALAQAYTPALQVAALSGLRRRSAR